MSVPSESWQTFRDDLLEAWRVWRRHPWLPVASVVLVLLVSVPAALFEASSARPGEVPGSVFVFVGLPTIPIAIFLAGWMGTERLVYLSDWIAEPLRPVQLWKAGWGYAGRFIALGLITIVPSMVVLVPVAVASEPESAPVLASNVAVVIIIEVVLTFVTPALAFSTGSVWQAIGIGLRTLRANWPLDATYVFVPPLLLAAFSLTTTDLATGFVLSAAWALTGLLAKGAIARFYLRQHTPDPDALPIHTISRSALRTLQTDETHAIQATQDKMPPVVNMHTTRRGAYPRRAQRLRWH